MAFWTNNKKKNTSILVTLRENTLPIYILLSAAFIIYVVWIFVTWTVYNAWIITGQEQWYVAAFQEVANEIAQGCEVVTLTLWDTQVNTINADCLEMWQDESMMNDEMMIDDEMFFDE